MRFLLLLCLLLPTALMAAAEPQAGMGALYERIRQGRLAEDAGWLALLHYHRSLSGQGWVSQADRDDFFFAADGKYDPHAEMIASVDAFLGSRAGDDDPRCRMPARYTWLQQRLGIQPDFDVLANCPRLAAWFNSLVADTVYIDFASAYLENPSSMFGHTFLRFEKAGTPVLLSPTVNYAADSSQREGVADFIFRGLFGGFPGLADQLPFYRRLRSYSDNEGRDIWEYRLRLEPQQIRFVLLHLWEIRNHTFDYYFLDENCSYRTLALLAVARPDLDLMGGFHGDVVPVETIKVLRAKGLADSPVLWPSAPRRLGWQTRDLSGSELDEVIGLAEGKRSPADVSAGSPERKALILAAAAEYLSIQINRGTNASQPRNDAMQALIQERLRLDHPLPDDPVPSPLPAEAEHSGHMVALAAYDRQGQLGSQIGYEGFQHELTDPLPGYERGAAVNVLGGHFRIAGDGHGEVEDLDVVDVTSAIPVTRLFSQSAWHLRLGAERKDIGFDRPLVGTAGYATGRAVDTPLGVLAGEVGLDFDMSPVLDSGVALEGRVDLSLTRQTGWLSYQAYFESARYLAGDDSLRHQYGVRIGVPLAHNWNSGISWQRDGSASTASEALFTIKWFF